MNYNKKYIKYKLKYNLLKTLIGGFKLTDEKHETYFYYKIKQNYYCKLQHYFNAILMYINLLELKDSFNNENIQKIIHEISQFIIKLNAINDSELRQTIIQKLTIELTQIIKSNITNEIYNNIFQIMYNIINQLLDIILKSDLRKEILDFFINNFINHNSENINIQYASFVFLSFFLEFELFLITYSNIPYNYFINTPSNFSIPVDSNFIPSDIIPSDFKDTIKFNNLKCKIWRYKHNLLLICSIFNKKFGNDILEILKYYVYYLESTYENFINSLCSYMTPKYPDFPTFLYKFPDKKEYNHLKHDWYDKMIHQYPDFNNKLSTFITSHINTYEYNTHQVGLFDFVFSLNNTQSCITMTTLKVYFTTRLHLSNFHIILQNEKENDDVDPHSTITELLPCNKLSHWECDDKQCFQSRIDMDTTQKLDIYDEKVEVFIALLFDIYNRYNELYKNERIIQHKEYVLNLIFNLLLDHNRLELFNKHYIIWINEMNNSTLTQLKTKFKQSTIKYTNLEQILDESKKEDFLTQLNMVKCDGLLLEHIYIDLQTVQHKTIVLEAVKQNGNALQFASTKMKNDREIVIEAVKQNMDALKYASNEIKKNKIGIIQDVLKYKMGRS